MIFVFNILNNWLPTYSYRGQIMHPDNSAYFFQKRYVKFLILQ